MGRLDYKKIFKKVARTVSEFRMLAPGESVLAGVSGGPDSVALVHLLLDLGKKIPFELGIAHLNHCLRGEESDRDEAFVRRFAKGLGLPFFSERADVAGLQKKKRLSLEEAARVARYEFFHRVSREHGYKRTALGHNADDNAELILMYLMRGSGSLGLSGIPAVREGTIIRPLIRLTRSEIGHLLQVKSAGSVTDSSNQDVRFMRNRIRHGLLPELKKSYNPGIVEALNRLGAVLESEEAWAEARAADTFERISKKRGDHRVEMGLRDFAPLHVAEKRRVVRLAVRRVKGDLRRIGFDHVEAVLDLCADGTASGVLDFPSRVRVTRAGDRVIFSRECVPLRTLGKPDAGAGVADFRYLVPRPLGNPPPVHVHEAGAVLSFSEISSGALPALSSTGHHVGFFDIDKLKFPLVIRNPRPGDRFTPLGMGGRQKLKKFFSSSQVPHNKRSVCPLLVSEGEIVWVAGLRMSEAAKIAPSTTKILKVELFLA